MGRQPNRKTQGRIRPTDNRIPLPFEKIVEGMLAVKPKKKPALRKTSPKK